MHGPCLSLAGADGIGNAGSGIGVARPATCMQGMRAGRAAPAISPRRFVGRHRAACFARLSAGLRTRGRGTRKAGCRLLVAASRGCAPVPLATSFPLTAAGQCRDWRASGTRRTGFPFHPVAQTAGTDGAQHSGVCRQGQRNMLLPGQSGRPASWNRVAPGLSRGARVPGTPRCASPPAARRCVRRRPPGARRYTAHAARRRRCTPG